MQILPNKIICELGRHFGIDKSCYPIEELRLCHLGSHLLSCSYDQINSWSISDIPTVWTGGKREGEDEEEEEEEKEEEGEGVRDRRKGGKKSRRKRRRKELFEMSKPPKKRDTFFDDL